MKILIADDHRLFREALADFLARTQQGVFIAQTGTVDGVMTLLRSHADFDIVLLDLKMPGMNGLSGLDRIRHAHPGLRVALLSGVAEESEIKKALAHGAAGYLPKTLSAEMLMRGIKKIMEECVFVARDENTGKMMPSYYSGTMDGEGKCADPAGDSVLTPRERDVLEYLLRGKSNKDIARALDLQVVTVKSHIGGICRKLGASNRTQAALMAREKGF